MNELVSENPEVQRECTFCRIVSGEIEAEIIYQDDSTIAILDLRQPTQGHALVIPRGHFETLMQLDPALTGSILTTTQKIAQAAYQAFAPEGLSIWQSNGPAAFQEVPHFHMHVMPRWNEDGLLRVYPGRASDLIVEPEIRADQAAALRHQLVERGL